MKISAATATDVNGSLFANYAEFQKAAVYAHRHFLSKKYNNGSVDFRWANQRSIIQFENGQSMDVPKQFILGIEEAQKLDKGKKNGEMVTLEEIVALYNKKRAADIKAGRVKALTRERVGDIDLDALNAVYRMKVVKIIHRPNHDTMHSIRAAAFIKAIHSLISIGKPTPDQHTELDKSRVEKLQLMMLFSVLGREDETGFGDKKNANLYNSYRVVDALEFLKYCLDNW
ncbi:MAG TPA: SidE phosphodiesterase domain-containing protein, partial [Gammaproteobacteria bacterium]|nr:SidE phosphodiesterase domain-containing protein [Gammaproteobacteria bacterium]